jgi:hypothetical protein
MPGYIPLTYADDKMIEVWSDDITEVRPEGSLTRVYFLGRESRLFKETPAEISILIASAKARRASMV